MKVKMKTNINPGEMVTLKQEDYKAPQPTGDYFGYVVNNSTDFPIGVVLDERLSEEEMHTCSEGVFVHKMTKEDEVRVK